LRNGKEKERKKERKKERGRKEKERNKGRESKKEQEQEKVRKRRKRKKKEKKTKEKKKPSTHDIAVTRKDLSQGRDNDIRKRKEIDIKAAESVIDDQWEAKAVGKETQTPQIGTLQERIGGKLAEHPHDRFLLQDLLQSVKIVPIADPKEVGARAELLEDVEGVQIRKAELDSLAIGQEAAEESEGVVDCAHAAGEEEHVLLEGAHVVRDPPSKGIAGGRGS
jgi:flagellar biosynthesis GTPase FlhF